MLETIWFVLWGILWAVYFMLDGFDLGIGSLMPFLAKSEDDRRIMYRSVGPFWDGNEVWLITAGGVTFAAFPLTYAVMFSSLYSALMLVLFALIVRAVSIDFRGKVESSRWKTFWDIGMWVGSLLPAVLFGVAFANIFKGVPIDAERVYRGSLLTLLNPYGILGGMLFLLLFLEHGAVWLAFKSEGALRKRSLAAASRMWPLLLVVAVAFFVATGFYTRLYENYLRYPVLGIVPLAAVAGLLLVRVFIGRGRDLAAWAASSLCIAAATLFGVIGLYPYLLPSALDPSFGLTVFNSSSSQLTLKIMLAVVLVFLPVVIGYQVWAYRLFREKATRGELSYEESY